MEDEEIFGGINQTVAEIRQSFDDDYDYRYADYDNCITNVGIKTLRELSFDRAWDFTNEYFR